LDVDPVSSLVEEKILKDKGFVGRGFTAIEVKRKCIT